MVNKSDFKESLVTIDGQTIKVKHRIIDNTTDDVTRYKNYFKTNAFRERMKTLTTRELRYLRYMLPQSGVLFLTAQPGVGKSAIAKSIARKLLLQYLDIRLSIADETDLQFPNLVMSEEIQRHIIEYAVPEWAVLSNQKPTLIHFEELNRTSLAVRNAALQILLERGIGPKFSFNQNVLMMSSGNLGDKDGTSVEEFESALNNRLIHVAHDLTIAEWVTWGKNEGMVHPVILNFISSRGHDIFITLPSDDDESGAYATPRTWTMLSDHIMVNYSNGVELDSNGEVVRDEDGSPLYIPGGYEYDFERDELVVDGEGNLIIDYGDLYGNIDMIKEVCPSIVGPRGTNAFLRYLTETKSISIKDVLNDYPSRAEFISGLSSDMLNDIVSQAKKENWGSWSDNNIQNFHLFMRVCQPELQVSFITEVLDNVKSRVEGGIKNPVIGKLLGGMRDVVVKVSEANIRLNGTSPKRSNVN